MYGQSAQFHIQWHDHMSEILDLLTSFFSMKFHSFTLKWFGLINNDGTRWNLVNGLIVSCMTLDVYLLTLNNIKLLCVSLVYPWFLLHSILPQNTTLHYKCSILCVIQVICTYGHANVASGWQDEVWRFPDRIGFIKRTTCFLEFFLQKWSIQEKICLACDDEGKRLNCWRLFKSLFNQHKSAIF